MKIQSQRSIKFGPFWIGNKYNISKVLYVITYYFLLKVTFSFFSFNIILLNQYSIVLAVFYFFLPTSIVFQESQEQLKKCNNKMLKTIYYQETQKNRLKNLMNTSRRDFARFATLCVRKKLIIVKNTVYCSLFFVIVINSEAFNSLNTFIVHSFNIAIGVNQFEWLTLKKQYNSVDSDTILKINLKNYNNQILEQSQITDNDDHILKENLVKELNHNPYQKIYPMMKNKHYISQKKKNQDQMKFKQQVSNPIIEHEKNATFQNYFKNLGKLIISEIPKSELD